MASGPVSQSPRGRRGLLERSRASPALDLPARLVHYKAMANRKSRDVKAKLTRSREHEHGSLCPCGYCLGYTDKNGAPIGDVPDTRPTVHVVGLPHTIPDERFSHCAFTGKVMRFPAVLHEARYRVVEYSNGAGRAWADAGHDAQGRRLPGRETVPDQHVPIFTEAQLEGFFGDRLYTHTTTENHKDQDVKAAFMALVVRALKSNVKPGDIVAHLFGPEPALLAAGPQAIHVETGIGYAAGPIGCYRIFESESWRAWHFGKYTLTNNGGGGTWPDYPEIAGTAICPNYYDIGDWALGEGLGLTEAARDHGRGDGAPFSAGGPYLLFVGRMASIKGVEIVDAIARALPDITVAVITGEPYEAFKAERMQAPNLLWVGRVSERAELARWYGGALATLVPSMFHEPFGGVVAESLLCGTPVIGSDFAAPGEHVQDGDGLRCMTRDDFVTAARLVVEQSAQPGNEWQGEGFRKARQQSARARWSTAVVALQYKAALEHFRRMHTAGIAPPGHPMVRPMPEGI